MNRPETPTPSTIGKPVRIGVRLTDLFGSFWKTKLLRTLTILTAVVPLMFAGFYIYRNANQVMTESVLAKRENIAYLIATVLGEKFDRLIDVGTSLSTRVRFRQLIEQGKWTEAIKIMEEIPSTLPYVQRLVIADSNGTIRADTPPVAGVRGKNYSQRDWYQGVMRTKKPYLSEIYKRAIPPQDSVIAAAIPIRGANKEILGVLVIQVELDAFFGWFKDAPPTPESMIYIVDRHAQTAFHPRFATKNQTVNLSEMEAVQRALAGQRGVVLDRDASTKKDMLNAYAPVPRYGWGVVLEESTATAFAARDALLRRYLISFTVILLLSGFSVFLLMLAREHARLTEDLERMVTERTAELQAANKELEAFSYSVSHDLRSPLRSIDGFSRLVLDDCADKLDPEHQSYLQRIRAATKRMAELIDDLLNLSQITRVEMKREVVDLSAIAHSIVQGLRESQPERQVEVSIRDDLKAIGDPSLLRAALQNLLDNAWKFTGRIADAQITLGTQRDASGQAVYFVRDNGAGFDMHNAKKLFGAFQRMHNAEDFPGTGVGLATVQRIVRRHGGKVWVETSVGEGATFYFTLSRV